MVAGFAYR